MCWNCNLYVKTDHEYSNGYVLWHGGKLCHIVTKNRTTPESDFDIRPRFFPEVISVLDFGDELNSSKQGRVKSVSEQVHTE